MFKKILFFCVLCISIVFSFSQNKENYVTNEEGKIFFITNNEKDTPINSEFNKSTSSFLLDWSNSDFNISDNQLVDSWNSRVDIGNNGTAYVVYNDNHSNGLQKIMFRKKEVSGNWSEPIFVDAGGEIGGRNNHLPAIAVSQNNDLHVIYNVWAFENTRNYIGYSYYNALSETWSDGVKISEPQSSVNHVLGHHDVYTTDNNLPVVIWGYDYRENQVNEEIYMKYFDGTNWSNDIMVSNASDELDAYEPYIKSIGNNKAMIIFAESIDANDIELKYRIYDEITHQLSAIATIPVTSTSYLKYDLVKAESGNVIILTTHSVPSPWRDIISTINYDIINDSFTPSHSYTFTHNTPGPNSLNSDIDCTSEENCGIIYTDTFNSQNGFLEYNETSGFGETTIINEQNLSLSSVNCKFDTNGNLHVVWDDLRFDDGVGFQEREVFYKVGENNVLGLIDFDFSTINIYPNPSNGTFLIDSKGAYELEIFDIVGRLINKKTFSENTTINLKISGIYYLRFKNDNLTFTKKVLIK